MCPEGKTEDGFDMQMGTNHFGHFAFTELVMPLIRKSSASGHHPRYYCLLFIYINGFDCEFNLCGPTKFITAGNYVFSLPKFEYKENKIESQSKTESTIDRFKILRINHAKILKRHRHSAGLVDFYITLTY